MRAETNRETFTIPNGRIILKQGIEGPDYDPYFYNIIEVERNGNKAKIRMGLATCVWVNDEEILLVKDDNDSRKIFEQYLGCSIESLERALDRCRSTCSKCGGYMDETVNGYPGEILYVCNNGHIMGGSFNESVVI